MKKGYVESTAVMSPCETFRYLLTRRWNGGAGICVFLCLNPSTADGTSDDATIRRCVNFAKDWGYEGMKMVNLYAFRSRHPSVMAAAQDPVGPQNLEHILRECLAASVVVAAWGVNADVGHANSVLALLEKSGVAVHAFGLSKAGFPLHPLMLARTLVPRLLRDLRQE